MSHSHGKQGRPQCQKGDTGVPGWRGTIEYFYWMMSKNRHMCWDQYSAWFKYHLSPDLVHAPSLKPRISQENILPDVWHQGWRQVKQCFQQLRCTNCVCKPDEQIFSWVCKIHWQPRQSVSPRWELHRWRSIGQIIYFCSQAAAWKLPWRTLLSNQQFQKNLPCTSVTHDAEDACVEDTGAKGVQTISSLMWSELSWSVSACFLHSTRQRMKQLQKQQAGGRVEQKNRLPSREGFPEICSCSIKNRSWYNWSQCFRTCM